MQAISKPRRVRALWAVLAAVGVTVPIVVLTTGAFATSSATTITYSQGKSGATVQYTGANGNSSMQSTSLVSGSCSSSTVSNPAPAPPLLPLSANYYGTGTGTTSVGSAVVSGVAETGVCSPAKTPGNTIQAKEGLVFSMGETNPLTAGQLFSLATIPLKNNLALRSVTGTLILRKAGTTVGTVPFTLPAGLVESPGDTNDCPVISTGAITGGFDQLEVQVSSPSNASASVIGPNCDNDNDKDDVAVPTFTLANSAPVFSSATSTTFAVGNAGSFMVSAPGTPTPAISEMGTLPKGVTLTDNKNGTATLAGTPSAGTGGNYPITISAGSTNQNFTLYVDQAPAINSANNATFTVGGSSNSFDVTTANGTYPAPMFSLSPSPVGIPGGGTCTPNMPPVDSGLGINSSTGVLTATPAADDTDGPWTLCIVANNNVAPQAVQQFTLTINEPPAITSANNATFTVGGASNSFTVTASGVPSPTFALSNGTVGTCTPNMPPADSGLGISSGTGVLTATPAADDTGSWTLCIVASNTVAPQAVQQFTLTINEPPAINSPNNAIVPASTALTTTNSFIATASGSPAAAFSLLPSYSGTPPQGVSCSSPKVPGDLTTTTTSVPAGAPAGTTSAAALTSAGGLAAGTYCFTIDAGNGVGSDSQQPFILYVTSPDAPLQATNSGDTTASLTVNSGSKSFTNFLSSGTQGATTENPATVTFLTEGTSTYTATLTVNWGDIALCSFEGSDPNATPCAPAYVITPTYTGYVPACSYDQNGNVTLPSLPAGVDWCSESASYAYVWSGGSEYTSIQQTLFGDGDLTIHRPG